MITSDCRHTELKALKMEMPLVAVHPNLLHVDLDINRVGTW